MTPKGRLESAASELSLAVEELATAAALLETSPRIALTRIYYAAFHATRARLFAEGLEPKTHAGVQHLFNVTFVRSGSYEPATSSFLARLQKYREEADYSTAYVVDPVTTRQELDATRAFVARIQSEIAPGAESR